MFAVVDIETTGGQAYRNGITEIAIVLTDGREIKGEWTSLINPEQTIPSYITGLTHITNSMVALAPKFEEVAQEIFDFLGQNVFVAHNVQFDYSFLFEAFKRVGLDYRPKMLCTVRYARKLHPEFRRYSLGSLIKNYHIENEAAHRAFGDARATVQLLHHFMEEDSQEIWRNMIKRRGGELNLPQFVKKEIFDNLPNTPGVYYLKDISGKPLYIGKAKEIKTRVGQHFSQSKGSSKTTRLHRETYFIDYVETGSEIMAMLLEDSEIRKYWPPLNKAQKRPSKHFGVFLYTNQKGESCLQINQIVKQSNYLARFFTRTEAHRWVSKIMEKYKLSSAHCGYPSFLNLISQNQHEGGIRRMLRDLKDQQKGVITTLSGRNLKEVTYLYLENDYVRAYMHAPQMQIEELNELKGQFIHLDASPTSAAIVRSELESFPKESFHLDAPKIVKESPKSMGQQSLF